MNSLETNAETGREVLPQIADHVLIRRIGRGGYGEVWLARNMTGAFRAVKVIYRHKFVDVRPFQREFEGIRKFDPLSHSHPGLVKIFHVGQNVSAGYFYYLMELADDARTGQIIDADTYVPKTLREELTGSHRPPLRKNLETALSLASALGHLHAQGLIHRDIKPSNIIFVNGHPKFADVGLMTEVGEDVSAVGSIGFMPPEEPGNVTGDIFSLGKVFYELFMGLPCKRFPELPGAAEEFTTIPALLQLNKVILKACHHDPKQRFQTAAELHNALREVTQTVHDNHSSSGAHTASDSDRALPSLRASGQSTGEMQGQPVENGKQQTYSRWTRRAALFLLLPGVAGTALFLMNRRKPVTAPPNGRPLIVLMDTTAERGVYNKDNIGTGRSNADELYTGLAGLDGILSQNNFRREGIGWDWLRESVVVEWRPDIVIIHRSSFFHPFAAKIQLPYPTSATTEEELERWQAIYDSKDVPNFIRTVGAFVPRTQFLVYSTGTDKRWLDDEYRTNWVKSLERNVPALKGRINVMAIKKPTEGTEFKGFRDPAIMDEVRQHVREMLKKLEEHQNEKTK